MPGPAHRKESRARVSYAWLYPKSLHRDAFNSKRGLVVQGMRLHRVRHKPFQTLRGVGEVAVFIEVEITGVSES
ncbi:MAG: hypothetical protein ABSA41_18485 [Terriglobia bacterium]